MAVTSKFIQLDPQVLVEYRYHDPSAPEQIETDANGARILLLDNAYTNSKFLFTEEAPVIPTGNQRNISAVPINANKTRYAWLADKTAVNYLDFDDNLNGKTALTNQTGSAVNNPTKNITYDTIRVHMVSGFTFANDSDGIIFEVLVEGKNNIQHNLASIAYLKSDEFETLNPSPLLIGERLYTNYIEVKVPSLDWLISEYENDSENEKGLAYNLTSGEGLQQSNGVGLKVLGTVDLSLKKINSTDTENGFKIFNIGDTSTTSINKIDEYSGLAAIIRESTAGDYYEVFGEFNGDIYEDFIVDLNNQSNADYTVIHEITVNEQIGDSFVQTAEMSYVQDEDWDEPYRFRPIIVNSNIAVSYRLNYTLRIYNKFDNSQILRTSQITSFDVKKYGKKLPKINLGVVPTVAKVYNKVEDTRPNITVTETVYNREKIEFVTNFIETIKVNASINPIKLEPAEIREGDVIPTDTDDNVSRAFYRVADAASNSTIYNQGEAPLGVSPFDTFVKFVFFDNAKQEATGATDPQFLDLSTMGDFFLSFFDEETGDQIRIPHFDNVQDLNLANGEVVFKINKGQAQKLIKYSTNKYYVTSRLTVGSSNSDETLLYTGKWYKLDDKVDSINSQAISELNGIIKELNEQIEATAAENAQTVEELENEVEELRGLNKRMRKQLSIVIDEFPEVANLFDDIDGFKINKKRKLRKDLRKKKRPNISRRERENIRGKGARDTKFANR